MNPTTGRPSGADLEQHRERVHRDASLERDLAYDRAIARGIDTEHARLAGQNAYNAHYARNGHPDDSMTRHTREWVAIERRVQAAVKLGANYWTFSDPVATARAHRATAARTTVDHRRDTGTTTQASRRSDTGARATGGRGDDDPDDDDGDRRPSAVQTPFAGVVA